MKHAYLSLALLIILLTGNAASGQNPDDITGKFHPRLLELNQDIRPSEPLSSILSSIEATVSPDRILLNNLYGVKATIKNGTNRPIVVDGEHATIAAGGSALQGACAELINANACVAETAPYKYRATAERIVAAAVTLGAAPAARDALLQRGPILRRYGCDEKRRETELCWFGKRIIWPGQSLQGIIYFNARAVPFKMIMQIPISTVYDDSDRAAILIQL